MQLFNSIKSNIKKYLFLIIGFTLTGISLLIFQALIIKENDQIKKIVRNQLITTEEKIKSQIDTKSFALDRMAKRWQTQGGTPKAEWEKDALNYIRDYQGYQAIEWVDSNYYVRWIIPKEGNEKAINLNLAFEPKIKEALEISKNKQDIHITKTVDLVQGEKGFLIYFPLFVENKFDGFIVGVVKSYNLLSNILKSEAIQGYHVFIYDQSDLIYSTIFAPEYDNIWKQETSLNYRGVNWRIVLIPNHIFIKNNKSILPKVVLITGFTISWLLALAINLTLKYQNRNLILKEEIKQRQLIEIKLKDLSLLQKAILDSANYMIISTSVEGIILTFNKAAEKMLGYTVDEVVHKLTPVIFHDFQEIVEESKKLSEELEMIINPGFEIFIVQAKQGKIYEKDWTYIRKDNSRFPVNLSATALTNSEGHITGFLGVATDISKQKEAEAKLQATFQELETKKIEAEAANRAKSEFLAMMSHEIRTPMNGIIGMTEIMLSTDLSPQQRDFMETIRSSGDSLLIIINDLLDFSQIESGKLELENIDFNLQKCVKNCFNLFSDQAERKNLELAYHWNPETPKIIQGDPTRIRQIIVNLLNNAIKFTKKGKIILSVSAKPINQNNICELEFFVKDTGIGIGEKKIDRLFKSFSQVDASNNRKYGGTGLGLAISKSLVEMMGGKIWVESKLDKGSTFFFTIPVKIAKNKKNTTEKTTKTPEINKTSSNLKILLAEDNRVNQKVALQMLKKLGYSADIAGNGLEVIDAVKRQKYDIIFMDVQMPKMDGLEATHWICENLSQQEKPQIIAMTANAMEGDKEICLDAGMDDYIAKPVKLVQLKNIFDKI
jgi:PAS domain S-box-containing protein